MSIFPQLLSPSAPNPAVGTPSLASDPIPEQRTVDYYCSTAALFCVMQCKDMSFNDPTPGERVHLTVRRGLENDLRERNQMRISRRLRRCSGLTLLVVGISGWASVSVRIPRPIKGALVRANAIEPSAKRASKVGTNITLHAHGQGNPLIGVDNGHDLPTTYFGNTELTELLEQNLAEPLTLVSGDFDEDGMPDVVAGYVANGQGILTLHRGNVKSVFPNSSMSEQGGGEVPETASDQTAIDRIAARPCFLAAARVFELAEAPNFLGAGDFDGDDHWDAVAAARGSNSLFLLSGDGQGGFKKAKAIEIPGSVTALETGEINRADGLTDIVVAMTGEDGSKVLVFESPEGALRGKPEAFAVLNQATALAFGQLDEDFYSDLAVAAGDTLVIVRGRDRKLSLDKIRQAEVQPAWINSRLFPFAINSIAAGDFTGSHKSELAVLTADGSVQVVGRSSTRSRKGADPSALQVINTVSGSESARLLIKARVSSEPRDTLIEMDSDKCQLRIVVTGSGQLQTAGRKRVDAQFASGDLQAILDVDGEPAAVLPMRLNEDALSDLVILRKGSSAPTVALTAAAMTFTVTKTNDSGAGSLRQAILDANANPGADTIRFSIASGEKTITPGSALPVVTDPLTIDGTSQPGFTGKPIIEINGKKVQANGLSITGGNSVVRGLVINRFRGIFSIGSGIYLSVNGGNLIEGNFIGTDSTGTIDKGNEGEGILCSVPNNRIGGTVEAARNIISGNDQAGIYLLGPEARGNVIQGNFIGIDVTGTATISNPFVGVYVDRAPINTVGGTVAAARNVISNPSLIGSGEGIILDGLGTSGNLIQGNFIGTDASGNVGLGNSIGVEINTQASANTIGGTVAAARNIISNNRDGIYLFGSTTDTLVQGNFIGTDVTGRVPLGNILGVISNFNTVHNTIGGVIAGARNIISGNTRTGMTLNWNDSQVQGNLIGTDVTGIVALGNGGTGVVLNSGARNLIGGIEVGARNIVSGNGLNGININSAGNQVQGNFIGTDVTGVANLGNAFYGVLLTGAGNIVGGTSPGTGNTIAFNGGPGINVVQSSGIGIRRNSIFANGGLGIDLGGNLVTPNDQCDSDGGPNNLQNFPVITSVVSSDASTVIEGTLNSRPGSTFTIEFFSNNSCDILGNGEGQTFIGSIGITTDSNCTASFNANLPVSVLPGQFITATATDSGNNTSEFSRCFPESPISGPRVFSAFRLGKDLIVVGDGFDSGATILINGEAKKTKKDEENATTRLIGKKVARKILPGSPVLVRVRNSDGSLSNQVVFTQ